jgi:hypothetical protein
MGELQHTTTGNMVAQLHKTVRFTTDTEEKEQGMAEILCTPHKTTQSLTSHFKEDDPQVPTHQRYEAHYIMERSFLHHPSNPAPFLHHPEVATTTTARGRYDASYRQNL